MNKNTEHSAVLRISAASYGKMRALVDGFSTEIGWHCLIRRGEAPFTYEIYDVLVYPQVVTGARTMAPDEGRYGMWLLQQEHFPDVRCQGHSHVNFGVRPSSVDIAYYKDILKDVPKDGFYLFLVLNKKGEWTKWLFDKGLKTAIHGKDIRVEITDPIIDEAKQIVKQRVYNKKGDADGSHKIV